MRQHLRMRRIEVIALGVCLLLAWFIYSCSIYSSLFWARHRAKNAPRSLRSCPRFYNPKVGDNEGFLAGKVWLAIEKHWGRRQGVRGIRGGHSAGWQGEWSRHFRAIKTHLGQTLRDAVWHVIGPLATVCINSSIYSQEMHVEEKGRLMCLRCTAQFHSRLWLYPTFLAQV